MVRKNTTEEITNDATQTVATDTDTNIELKSRNLKFLRVVDYKRFFTISLIVLAVGGVYGSYYFYSKYQTLKNNPNVEAAKETERLVSALGKLIELPKGEIPTIATISDKEKLKDQPFFKGAENGDKLFAYNTAMIAILYRPSSNKIINVAPISINQPQDLEQGVKENKTTTNP